MRDNLEASLRNGLSTIGEFLPRLILFLIILVVGMFIAKAIGKAVNALLERIGFDRVVERGGVQKALATSKLDASDILAKLVYYTLALFVLQLAFGVFGPNPISDLITRLITFIPSLIVAIVIIVIASAIAAAVKGMIESTLGSLSYGKALANAASIFILFLGVVAALNQVGVATTVTTPVLIAILATVAGVIVVGVGGGLIKPMQHRWEGYLNKAEEEAPRLKQEMASSTGAAPSAPSTHSRVQAETQPTVQVPTTEHRDTQF